MKHKPWTDGERKIIRDYIDQKTHLSINKICWDENLNPAQQSVEIVRLIIRLIKKRDKQIGK